jgi:cell division protease FtsH
MVTRYGMSEKIGPIALESEGGRPIYGNVSVEGEYSQQVAALIDEEVARLINEAETRALKAIEDHRDLHTAIAKKLMEQETIEREEFEAMLREYGVKVKEASSKNSGVTIAEDLKPNTEE